MKRRKLNKKRVFIAVVILLIILLEIINPIKIYNKHVLKDLNYSNESIKEILNKHFIKEVKNIPYSKTLDLVFKSKDFKKENFDVYKELPYRELKNYTKDVNELVTKGYKTEEIKNIIKSATDDSIEDFLKRDYVKDINEYLAIDFSILGNYDRYIEYQKGNALDKEQIVLYVNLGLDKEQYEDPVKVSKFSYTMLVNKYNYLDEDFIPDDLVTVPNDYAVDTKEKVNKTALEAFQKMSDACKNEIGSKVLVRSAYRDYKSQEETYETYLNAYGKKYAENYVAHPGFSEHQTGLAIDIKAESSNTFKGTPESKWLIENAYKYGFILRYESDTEEITKVKSEAWHYRYVGLDIANYIHENDMTFDEYYIRFLNK